MSQQLSWLNNELDDLRRAGLARRRREFIPLSDGSCVVNGRRLIDFASNDYLGLARDPRLIAAAVKATQEAGTGASSSALISGRTEWHVELERRLAEFEGQPAAILFPSGYAANVGTITALAESDDVLFCNRFNHASLIDGCRLSKSRLVIYRHDELESLERELEKARDARRRYVVTDTVFSMDADLAPLPILCDIAERHDATLIVDEAHATGVFGERGRGVAELQQVEHRIAVRIGTLSKAIGSLGGFVTGSAELIDWLWNKARTQMFSTALPPAACAAATAALDVIATEPFRREVLAARSTQLRQSLRALGCEVPGELTCPIVPVIVGEPDRAVAAASKLEERGYFVGAIRPPTVPHGTSRLRITVHCGHTSDEVAALAAAVGDVLQGV
ncbi:MAG: 8-amino-7-oxononanoate synthase [Planctomycetales bacterium]|nr:8-amino-7-oxononanoate synthase [Planctomycetales bacterium]